MKKLLFLFLLAGFISCKKDDSGSQGLPAKTLLNTSYGNDPAQVMDIYLPANRNTDSTHLVIMIHGGAWISGDKSEFTPYVARIQQLLPGYAVANINYRLASTNGNFFPTQENDVKAAISFLLQKKSEYVLSDRIVLFGGSAGGHLALLQAYKNNNPKIRAVVDFFGPTDMVGMYNFSAVNPVLQGAMQLLMGGTPASNPSMYASSSPINFVTPQSTPTIIFHGDQDDVVPLTQSVQLKTKLQAEGVPHQLHIYPGLNHDAWPTDKMNDALNKARDFVKTHNQ